MNFKTDATKQYTLIRPTATILNSFLAAQLAAHCQQLSQNGSNNFIIDLQDCSEVASDFLSHYCDLYLHHASKGQSFVIAHIPAALMQQLRDEDAIDSINYAPSLVEAEDIVKMEILEREMFDE